MNLGNSEFLSDLDGYGEAMTAARAEDELARTVAEEDFQIPGIEHAYISELNKARLAKQEALANPTLQEGVARIGEKALTGLTQIDNLRIITQSQALPEIREQLLDNLHRVHDFYNTFGLTTEISTKIEERLRSLGQISLKEKVQTEFNTFDEQVVVAKPIVESTPGAPGDNGNAVANVLETFSARIMEHIADADLQPDRLTAAQGQDSKAEQAETKETNFPLVAVNNNGVTLLDTDTFIPYNSPNPKFKEANGAVRSAFIKRHFVIALLANPDEFQHPRDIVEKMPTLDGEIIELGQNERANLSSWLFSEKLRIGSEPLFVNNGGKSLASAYRVNPALVSRQDALPEEANIQKPFEDTYPEALDAIEQSTHDVPHTPLGDTYVLAAALLHDGRTIIALKDFGSGWSGLSHMNSSMHKDELLGFRPDRIPIGRDSGKLIQYNVQSGKNLVSLLSSDEHAQTFIDSIESAKTREFLYQIQNIIKHSPDQETLSRLLSSRWVSMGENQKALVYDNGGKGKILWPLGNEGFSVRCNEVVITAEEKRSSDHKNKVRRQKIDEIASIVESVAAIFIDQLGDADDTYMIPEIRQHIGGFNASSIRSTGLKRLSQNLKNKQYSVEDVSTVLILNTRNLASIFRREHAYNEKMIERVIDQAIDRVKERKAKSKVN